MSFWKVIMGNSLKSYKSVSGFTKKKTRDEIEMKMKTYLVFLEYCAWAWHSSFGNWTIFLFSSTSESSRTRSAARGWRRTRFPWRGGEKFAAQRNRWNRTNFRSLRRRLASSFVSKYYSNLEVHSFNQHFIR